MTMNGPLNVKIQRLRFQFSSSSSSSPTSKARTKMLIAFTLGLTSRACARMLLLLPRFPPPTGENFRQLDEASSLRYGTYLVWYLPIMVLT